MSTVDLAYEMAAARERLAERTRCALRDSRVLAIRAVVRPGATRADVGEIARSFYPRLSPDLIEEATRIVCEIHRIPEDEPATE